MVEPVQLASIDQVLDEHDRFDLFLFDQYGVLHDGNNTYPGMVETISRIKAAGKFVAVISNSGKRAAYNEERLAGFGFGADLIDCVVTSGEVAWASLQQTLAVSVTASHTSAALPSDAIDTVDDGLCRVLFIGRGGDRSAIEGLPVQETDDPDNAELILITGSDPQRHTLEQYATLLRAAAQRGVPAYCTNPDRWALSPHGLQFGAGQIASNYESCGGAVTWIGKPHEAIYRHALGVFDVAPGRVLCIGDSVEHDIVGARRAGCASLLTATGIHAELTVSELAELYERYDASPGFLIERSHTHEPH